MTVEIEQSLDRQGGQLYSGFDLVRQFFKRVQDEGADKKVPGNEKRERNLQIIRAYLEDQSASYRDVSSRFNMTKQRVQQIVKGTLVKLWDNASEETKRLFPQEVLSHKKRETVEFRIKRFEKRGRISARAAQMLGEGKPWYAVKSELELSGRKLQTTRRTLRRWGFDFLQTTLQKNKILVEQLRSRRSSDEKIRKALNSVNLSTYKERLRGEHPVVTPVSTIVRECGFHFTSWRHELSIFIQLLEEANIPVGVIEKVVGSGSQRGIKHYHFIASQHKDRVHKALLKDPRLGRFCRSPVEKIYGPESKVPTATQLQKISDFGLTGKVFAELGIYFSSFSKIKQRDIFDENCPVPIFYWVTQKGLFYPTEQKEILKSYIQKRLGELRHNRSVAS